jgi:hypothetical protein
MNDASVGGSILTLLFLICIIFSIALFLWGLWRWTRDDGEQESRGLMKVALWFILTAIISGIFLFVTGQFSLNLS